MVWTNDYRSEYLTIGVSLVGIALSGEEIPYPAKVSHMTNIRINIRLLYQTHQHDV